MRWHVHGTDSLTGQDVELALDEQEASRAVKTAIEHNIIVSHVTRAGNGWLGWLVAGCTMLAAAAIISWLYFQNVGTRQNLQQALDEQSRLAQSVSLAEQSAKDLRDHGNLAAGPTAQMNQLAEDLAASRSRLSLTDEQLTSARKQMDALQQTAAKLPDLEKKFVALHEQLSETQQQLTQSRQLADRLGVELLQQSSKLEAQNPKLSEDAAKIAELDRTNKDLAAQIEKLTSELLIAAAQPAAPAPTLDPTPSPSSASPWALAMSFDAAREFFLLHVDPDSVVTAPAGSLFTTTGTGTANALRLQFTHDRAKERVYSATLTLSLAADAPKDKLEENRKTIADFLATFAPTLPRTADISTAIAQLANQDDSHRTTFLAPTAQLTLWNNKSAVYTFRIEAVKAEE